MGSTSNDLFICLPWEWLTLVHYPVRVGAAFGIQVPELLWPVLEFGIRLMLPLAQHPINKWEHSSRGLHFIIGMHSLANGEAERSSLWLHITGCWKMGQRALRFSMSWARTLARGFQQPRTDTKSRKTFAKSSNVCGFRDTIYACDLPVASE